MHKNQSRKEHIKYCITCTDNLRNTNWIQLSFQKLMITNKIFITGKTFNRHAIQFSFRNCWLQTSCSPLAKPLIVMTNNYIFHLPNKANSCRVPSNVSTNITVRTDFWFTTMRSCACFMWSAITLHLHACWNRYVRMLETVQLVYKPFLTLPNQCWP